MPKHYIVLGGGISGLALAWRLQKEPDVSVTLVEKEDRLGGWIDTIHIDGFLFDRGPRSCRTRGSGIATLKLIEELGLESETIAASPEAMKRYLYFNQRLTPLPSGLISFLSSPLSKGLFGAIWKDLRTPKSNEQDESVADFVERRLGKRFADIFFDPLAAGIYAGDIHKLSLRACFPFLAKWEEQQGGICKGLLFSKKAKNESLSPFVQKMLGYPMFSMKNGMETLPRSLASRLRGDIILSDPVQEISEEKDAIHVKLFSGKILAGDHLFCTLPSYGLNRLFPFLRTLCDQIPCASVAIVNLGYRKKLLRQSGFGYLIPSSEGEKVLGTVFDSCVFPVQAHSKEETRLTVMIGSSRIGDFDSWTKGQFLAAAQDALSRHLGIDQVPEVAEVKMARQAIPQYLVGHISRVGEIEKQIAARFPRVTLLGSSFYGVSVNDCISKAFCV